LPKFFHLHQHLRIEVELQLQHFTHKVKHKSKLKDIKAFQFSFTFRTTIIQDLIFQDFIFMYHSEAILSARKFKFRGGCAIEK